MRVPRSAIPVLAFALALAINLSAAAQSPATNNSQSQSAPAQAAPPAQTQPNQSTSGGQGSAQANEDNPLNLTDDQKAKLRPIIMEENQQMEALRNDTTMTQEQKIARANQIRADASPKIKAVLTPEQLQKLSQLQQERAREQQQQSQPAPPSTQPQNQPQQSQPPQK